MNNGFYTYPYYYTGMRNITPMMYNMPIRTSPLSFLTRGANPISSIVKGTSKFSFSNILNGASKTLGVINQAIPVVNQVKPIWKNAKTMLRMVKAMNTNDIKQENSTKTETDSSKKSENTKKETNTGPTFFK